MSVISQGYLYFVQSGETFREVSSEEKRVVVADGQTREIELEVDFAPKEETAP